MIQTMPKITGKMIRFLNFGYRIKNVLNIQGIPAKTRFHIKKMKCTEPVLYILKKTSSIANVHTKKINKVILNLSKAMSLLIMFMLGWIE
jgi:hypothetical protein